MIFVQSLKTHMGYKSAASVAAQRLRSVLATDRCLLQQSSVKLLNADVMHVLEQYFSVSDFSFVLEKNPKTEEYAYKLEAQLAIL